MPFDCLKLEKKDATAIITLNSPETRNAIDANMRAALCEAIADVKSDENVRVVIITGAGEKAFCAGGDLRAMQKGISVSGGRDKIEFIHSWMKQLADLEKPVIAAVNGFAIGAGFGLALACDIIIASENAKFACTFNKVGLVPDYGTMYSLPRAVGMLNAKDILMTARMVSAEELKSMGGVTKVVPQDKVMDTALELAAAFEQTAPYALGLAKRLTQISFESSRDQMYQYESLAQGLSYQTEDHHEGVNAFLEKRTPVYTGK